MGVTLSTTARDLVRTNFVAKDFDTYVSEIQSFILARFGDLLYNNFNASDTGSVLIESVSYALSNASWFVDRQSGEVYIETVEIPTNAARLTRLVGYKPAGAVPSSGNVEITLSTLYGFPVVISKGTQLLGPAGLIFETSADVTIPAGTLGPVTVGVVEGQTMEEVFSSDGSEGQIFRLRRVPLNTFIAQGSAVVTVAGVDWPVQDFIDFLQTNQVEIGYAESPPTMRFGDGIAGNIPAKSADVRIRYRATHGAAGAAQAGTITAFQTPVLASFTTISALVTNINATGPGSDTESLSKTKSLAPRVFRAAQRAVHEDDYTALVEAFVDPDFGSVAVGRAVSARSIDEDAETQSILLAFESLAVSLFGPLTVAQVAQFDALTSRLRTHWSEVLSSATKANLVSVQLLQKDVDGRLVPPNVNLVSALKTFLTAKREATATVSVTDGSVNLFAVDTTIQVAVANGFNRAVVLANVKAAIDDFLLTKKFGESVFLGDAYALIELISGVDHTNIRFTTPSSKLDQYGNIVVNKFEVVTLGTTTVTSI